MSTATTIEPASAARSDGGMAREDANDPPFRMTADEFQDAVEKGAWAESDARIYLRDGMIYEKMSKTNAHSILGAQFTTILVRRLPPGWSVVPEGQFKVNELNSRLPDVAVARGDDPREFLKPDAYPQAKDLVLVVEIAVSSLTKDLRENLERYARAGVPTYWVADFANRQILAHTRPRVVDGRGEYESVIAIKPGENVSLNADGREIGRFAYEDFMP